MFIVKIIARVPYTSYKKGQNESVKRKKKIENTKKLLESTSSSKVETLKWLSTSKYFNTVKIHLTSTQILRTFSNYDRDAIKLIAVPFIRRFVDILH